MKDGWQSAVGREGGLRGVLEKNEKGGGRAICYIPILQVFRCLLLSSVPNELVLGSLRRCVPDTGARYESHLNSRPRVGRTCVAVQAGIYANLNKEA